MDKQITVSAPGKLMLLGEHAVLYGRPCLVTAVDKRLRVTVNLQDEKIFKLNAPNSGLKDYQKPVLEVGIGEIPQEAKYVELSLANFLNKYKIPVGISITTESDFSSSFGLGSSSAATVAVIKALSELLQIKLTHRELFDTSFKTVLDVQKKGSGFDVAAAIHGGTIYFQNAGNKIEPLKADGMNLVIGYSGTKADTVSMINIVSEKMKNHKAGVEKIFDNIASLVDEAKNAIVASDWERLGTLMNFNQDYLEDLGVSTEKLNSMILAARSVGALGAKLSGAGGGDCMIALVSENSKNKVAQAIIGVGGDIINVGTNAAGVRTEK